MFYFQARFQEHASSGRFLKLDDNGDLVRPVEPDTDACVAKVNEEMETYPDPHWAACSCGWEGNNPYPDRSSAVSSLDKHYVQVGVKS